MELRTGTSLARLWSEQSRITTAQGLLSELRVRLTEGLETVDLTEAGRLLGRLESRSGRNTDEV